MDLQLAINVPSPIEKINLTIVSAKGIELYIKRDDLIHPWISGNKWRKLKYNLLDAKNKGIKTIVTFGGAFSNHTYAVAGVCDLLGLKSIGFIRGEIDGENPSIIFCLERNMELIGLNRSDYRLKEEATIVRERISQLTDYVVIPEGGSNVLSLKGVGEIWEELETQTEKTFDYIVLATGTGGTSAGLLKYKTDDTKLLCFSALKSKHLEAEILIYASLLSSYDIEVNNEYHFGGYAKWDKVLLDFLVEFEKETTIPLDHVYTGKAMYGLLDLIKKGHFSRNTQILFLHTGGLQGNKGLEYMLSK